MRLRNQLAALFSPTRRLIGPEATVLHSGGALGPREWVVARADCQYHPFDFSELPLRQRAPAALMAVRRHEPAPGARHYLAWEGGVAHAWIWSQPDEQAGDDDAGWIPETLLRAPPLFDGPRLLAQMRGFEGQLWSDGRLRASRWWPDVPQADAWRRFLRAGGLGPEGDGEPPIPEVLPWLPQPWGDKSRRLPGSPAALERLAWTAGIGLLALGLGWQLAAQANWSFALARVESRVEALRAQATPLLEARERADSALELLQQYQSLQSGSNDFAMMAQVMQPLPADARLVSWQREGERLQAGVLSRELDPRKYVSAFEGHPTLSAVVASPATDGKGMLLDFSLAAAAAALEPAP